MDPGTSPNGNLLTHGHIKNPPYFDKPQGRVVPGYTKAINYKPECNKKKKKISCNGKIYWEKIKLKIQRTQLQQQ
jgi:hypothetical protein